MYVLYHNMVYIHILIYNSIYHDPYPTVLLTRILNTCSKSTDNSQHPFAARHRSTCPAVRHTVRHAHSHTLCTLIHHALHSVHGQCYFVRARGIQKSVHMSSLCFYNQDLMVYLHPAAAHESYTRLHIHWPLRQQ